MKISKTAIFLFELMIIILVFSIAAAICTSIFAKGYQFSSESENLTHAVIRAESAAEKFKIESENASDSEIFFDNNWKEITSAEDAAFTMVLKTHSDGNLNTCEIDIINENSDESIYKINVAKFVQS